MVQLVEDRIRETLSGLDLAIAIDGGSASGLVGKAKIVVVTATALGVQSKVVEVVIIDEHETALIQAEIIQNLADKYSVPPDKIVYL
jgi:hypothetical protein